MLFFQLCNAQDANKIICDRIVFYQLPNGGWAKQYNDGKAVDYTKEIDAELLKRIVKDNVSATIDNKATTREIELLAAQNESNPSIKYQEAILKGIDYLLEAQLENGGFTQFYPDRKGYRGYVTFNDNAMMNVLSLLRDVGSHNRYSFVDAKTREKVQMSVQKGIDLVLMLQVKVNDTLTIWAAQYDANLLPAQARKFEPISLAVSESVAVVRFLLKEKPSPEIIESINAAVNWLEKTKIVGYRFDFTKNNNDSPIRNLVPDQNAIIWSRFYEIGTNRPLFGDRDDTVHYHLEEISEERQNGYAWYGSWPLEVLQNNYPKWLKSLSKNKK